MTARFRARIVAAVEEPDDEPATAIDGPPKDMERRDQALAQGIDVGGYLIDGELGRGGMGIVYAATHPVIGKRVAIKVLKQSLSNNPASVERFKQEARAVNQIGHPNIVDVFAFGELPDGRSYLVMDLLEGESLRKRLRRGPLPVRDALALIDEIAAALAAAHDKGIVHRDLKPDNVFLVAHPGRFDVRLLDFGLAKLLPTSALSARAFRTATGTQLGTPDYMSPEQQRGEVDHRTDIYSLGVMAFEVLAGTRLRRFADGTFDLEGTPAQVLGRIVPGEVAELIQTLLAFRPDDRPSLAAVQAVVRRVQANLPPSSVVGLAVPEAPAAAPAPAPAPALPVDSMTALGARPVLPTPLGGSPVLAAPDPAARRPPTVPPSASGSLGPAASQNMRPRSVSGLAAPGAPILTTQIGVPPPPVATPRPTGEVPAAAPEPRGVRRRVWLVVGALVLFAAGALAVVLAS